MPLLTVTLLAGVLSGTGLVSFLIALLIIAVIIYGVNLLMGMVSIHPNIKSLIWLVLAVIAIIYLLQRFAGVNI